MQTKNLEFVIDQATAGSARAALVAANLEGGDEATASAALDAQLAEIDSDPFKAAVRDSVEVGVVVPSIARSKLADAGFELVADEASLAEYGFASMTVLKRVLVTDKKGAIVAMGAAGNHDEALLHSILGYFREHPLEGSEVPAGIATAPGG